MHYEVGLALAMALSIPSGQFYIEGLEMDVRDLILGMTYAVVAFSILVQGMTIETLFVNQKKPPCVNVAIQVSD